MSSCQIFNWELCLPLPIRCFALQLNINSLLFISWSLTAVFIGKTNLALPPHFFNIDDPIPVSNYIPSTWFSPLFWWSTNKGCIRSKFFEILQKGMYEIILDCFLKGLLTTCISISNTGKHASARPLPAPSSLPAHWAQRQLVGTCVRHFLLASEVKHLQCTQLLSGLVPLRTVSSNGQWSSCCLSFCHGPVGTVRAAPAGPTFANTNHPFTLLRASSQFLPPIFKKYLFVCVFINPYRMICLLIWETEREEHQCKKHQ